MLHCAAMVRESLLSGVFLSNSYLFLLFKEEGTYKDNEIFRFICGTQDIHKQLEAKIARSKIKSLAKIINRMICLTIDMFVRLSYKILNEVLWTTDLHLNHILTLYTEL